MYEDATAKNYCSIPQFVYDVCVCHFSLHEMTPMRLREITDDVVDLLRSPLNSLTPKSVPAGTKNLRSEGFLLVKHKHTNIPTMMEPFAPPAAWFCRSSIPHPWEPTGKGLDEAIVDGFD